MRPEAEPASDHGAAGDLARFLTGITSVAKSLGAASPSPTAFAACHGNPKARWISAPRTRAGKAPNAPLRLDLARCRLLGLPFFSVLTVRWGGSALLPSAAASQRARACSHSIISDTTNATTPRRPQPQVVPLVVSDAAAVSACLRFADDHRLLVEPACGAALAPAYARDGRVAEAAAAAAAAGGGGGDVLVVVCGGAAVDLAALEAWGRQLGVGAAAGGGAR